MKHSAAWRVSFLAMAAALNLIGGSVALLFHLPVYLDSMGTMLSGMLLGPLWGMLPGLISGLIAGVTSDVYALYYIPVQLLVGGMTGLLFRKLSSHKGSLFRLIPAALLISVPGTVVSSCITALVFGGITSSGSTLLVQLLHHLGIGLIWSVCIVQALTDYVDRLLVLAASVAILSALPASLKLPLGKGAQTHGTL